MAWIVGFLSGVLLVLMFFFFLDYAENIQRVMNWFKTCNKGVLLAMFFNFLVIFLLLNYSISMDQKMKQMQQRLTENENANEETRRLQNELKNRVEEDKEELLGGRYNKIKTYSLANYTQETASYRKGYPSITKDNEQQKTTEGECFPEEQMEFTIELKERVLLSVVEYTVPIHYRELQPPQEIVVKVMTNGAWYLAGICGHTMNDERSHFCTFEFPRRYAEKVQLLVKSNRHGYKCINNIKIY